MFDDWVVLGSDMAALMVARALAIVVELVYSGIGAAATKDDERARREKKMAAIMTEELDEECLKVVLGELVECARESRCVERGWWEGESRSACCDPSLASTRRSLCTKASLYS